MRPEQVQSIPKELSTVEKQKKAEDFVKEAFCIDGPVELVHEPVSFRSHFKALDSKRGMMIIAFESRRK